MTTLIRTVATPHGDARLHVDRCRHPEATLLLCHGAGAGVDTADLAALAKTLPGRGVTVVRLEQPWKVAGRGVASSPRMLDEALIAAADRLRVRTPLIVGGRSAGARSACRSARALGAQGVLALAFPLHPPGRPDHSRADELATGLPMLVIQGERDTFGAPAEFPRGTWVLGIPDADHSFGVPARSATTADEVRTMLVDNTLDFIRHEILGNLRIV